MDEEEGGAGMVPEKRAEKGEEKAYRRKLAGRWTLIAIVVLFGSSVIWWDVSERAEIDARIEVLIEDTKKMRAEVEEMRRQIARARSSP